MVAHVEATCTTYQSSEGPMEQEKLKRGFACMSVERRQEIARQGGQAAHKRGTAHQWDKKTAAVAGRKGGQASRGGRGKTS